jgi:hypothetical protein
MAGVTVSTIVQGATALGSLSPYQISLSARQATAGFSIGGFMSQQCPVCKKHKVVTNGDRKYLGGFYRERVTVALVTLQPVICRGRKGCGKSAIMRKEYPLDNSLAPSISFNQQWDKYKNAKTNKPGPPIGGTTYSEFTLLTGRDTEDVCRWTPPASRTGTPGRLLGRPAAGYILR